MVLMQLYGMNIYFIEFNRWIAFDESLRNESYAEINKGTFEQIRINQVMILTSHNSFPY